jgi:telomerase reverse transcriptase
MKSTHTQDLGGSLFSVGDIYPKLKNFAAGLNQAGLSGCHLFFAKVDVQACFDTVPQKHLIEVVTALISAESYRIQQHAEVKPPEPAPPGQYAVGPKSKIKYDGYARPEDQVPYEQRHDPANIIGNQGTTVAVGPLGQQSHRKHKILALLKEHVEYNVVKIGKKYYRQKNGIPQGSVLSSLLCNFFYGKLEKDILQFTRRPDTILLRLIDDFLLITTERTLAEKFLNIMHRGVPDYGISVKAQKSLVNFDCNVEDYHILRSEGSSFPYCGLSIDTTTLDLQQDAERKSKMSKTT